MLLASIGVLAWLAWRGADVVALGLVAGGVAVQAALALRLARATAGGVGGHAEWVRETSRRPRIRQSPAWAVGAALVLAGLTLFLVR
jgi:hypothetical protein